MRQLRALVRAGLQILLMIVVLPGAMSHAGVQKSPPTIPSKLSAPGLQTKMAPMYPKLDYDLNRIIAAGDPMKEAIRLGYRTRDQRVQVYVLVEDDMVEEITRWLSGHGAAYISSANDIIQAHVTIEALRLLNNLDGPKPETTSPKDWPQ